MPETDSSVFRTLLAKKQCGKSMKKLGHEPPPTEMFEVISRTRISKVEYYILVVGTFL
jgi:hypothetical protein